MPSKLQLPENVSIYDGPNGAQLLNAKIFTRLVTTAPDTATLSQALADAQSAGFCHQHKQTVLIFDADLDTHHEHFRRVCLALKDHGDIGLEFAKCVFDARTVPEAGFQLDQLSGTSVMVIDLQIMDDESSSDDHEES